MATIPSRRARVLRRMAARGASVIHDPSVLVLSALGAGVGWALQLPAGAALAVGAGMLVAAGFAKALTTDGEQYVGSGASPPPLRRGTAQMQLVEHLRTAADQLSGMVPTFAGTVLGSSVAEASVGAQAAVESARRLAAAIDAIDHALARMHNPFARHDRTLSPQARQTRHEREAAVNRLQARREQLLSRIEAAYLHAEEVRIKLLEVSATLHAPSLDPAADSGLAAVSKDLEQLRRGLEELESTAAAQELPGA